MNESYTVEESNMLYEEGQLPGAKDSPPVEGAPESRPTEARCAVSGGSVALAIEELTALREWIKQGEGYVRDDAPDEIARAIANRIEQLKAREAKPQNKPDQPTPGE